MGALRFLGNPSDHVFGDVWNCYRVSQAVDAPSKQDRLHCASSFANQFSIAGITGLDKYQGFGSNVLNGALGNTFSGLVDAYDAFKGQNGKNGFMLLGAGYAGGVSLGLPLPSSTPVGLIGPVNVAVNAGLDAASSSSATTLFAETAIGEGISAPVALAKTGIDLATFAVGLAVCRE